MSTAPSLKTIRARFRELIPLFYARIEPKRLVLDYLKERGAHPEEWRPRAMISLGKVAGTLTPALSEIFGISPDRTFSVLPRGYPTPPPEFPAVFGSHPLPDASSLETYIRLTAFIGNIPESDGVLVALSGGASSILAAPVHPVTVSDKARITSRLIASGAPVEVINIIRIHLSTLKGGGLATLLSPRQSLTYCYSDIPGDDPTLVGSAPMHPVPRDGQKALELLRTWVGPDIPETVVAVLSDHSRRCSPEALPHSRFGGKIASSASLLPAASEIFLPPRLVPPPQIRHLTDRLAGLAHESGKSLAIRILEESAGQKAPMAFLASGETTVQLSPSDTGRGGRSLELGLSLALELGLKKAVVLALATDGWDGNSGLAGILVDTSFLGDQATRSKALLALLHHDTAPFLSETGLAVATGRTGNNLNDLLLVLTLP